MQTPKMTVFTDDTRLFKRILEWFEGRAAISRQSTANVQAFVNDIHECCWDSHLKFFHDLFYVPRIIILHTKRGQLEYKDHNPEVDVPVEESEPLQKQFVDPNYPGMKLMTTPYGFLSDYLYTCVGYYDFVIGSGNTLCKYYSNKGEGMAEYPILLATIQKAADLLDLDNFLVRSLKASGTKNYTDFFKIRT